MSIHTIEPGFLLASPRLGDPDFEGTVVLLGVHEEGGSIGWTVNGSSIALATEIVRATGILATEDILPAVLERPSLCGGPVSPESVWILYRRAAGAKLLPGSLAIGNEIAITSTMAALRSVIDGKGPREVRVLVGYAGWGPGQLETELAKGVWLPAAPDAALLFDDITSTLWQRAYQQTIGSIPTAFVGTTRGSA